MNKDSLGDRMKGNYEDRSRFYLLRRTPLIIRLDGKAFHSFTRGFAKPYDKIFHNAMEETMRYLCQNIQGCKLGYTQSDEITLLLIDYDTLTTDAWFDYNIQKVCSVSASMATMMFNKTFKELVDQEEWGWNNGFTPQCVEIQESHRKYVEILRKSCNKGAMFDARCFNIPKEEVSNCFIWRQQDATRNAIQMLGQCNFSHMELQNKSCNDIQDMLMTKKGINFNDMPTKFKRGVCCKREDVENITFDMETKEETRVTSHKWIIDEEIPIFTQDRDYIERLI